MSNQNFLPTGPGPSELFRKKKALDVENSQFRVPEEQSRSNMKNVSMPGKNITLGTGGKIMQKELIDEDIH